MRKADSNADRVVIEAEAIVQQAWVAQLRERYEEMQAAFSRAMIRRAAAGQSLAKAHRSGNRQQVAAERARLDHARKAASKLSQAVDRFRQVLAVEEAQLERGVGRAGGDHDAAE